MDMRNEIDKMLVDRRMTRSDLAAKLGITPGTLSARMNRGSFKLEFLQQVASACNADLIIRFDPKEEEG